VRAVCRAGDGRTCPLHHPPVTDVLKKQRDRRAHPKHVGRCVVRIPAYKADSYIPQPALPGFHLHGSLRPNPACPPLVFCPREVSYRIRLATTGVSSRRRPIHSQVPYHKTSLGPAWRIADFGPKNAASTARVLRGGQKVGKNLGNGSPLSPPSTGCPGRL